MNRANFANVRKAECCNGRLPSHLNAPVNAANPPVRKEFVRDPRRRAAEIQVRISAFNTRLDISRTRGLVTRLVMGAQKGEHSPTRKVRERNVRSFKQEVLFRAALNEI